MVDRGSLLIVGASVRAAAFSALRAGFHPWCIDLFADRDLCCRVPCHRIARRNYPEAIESVLHDAPPGPWMYTGGLENYPTLVDEWSVHRPLLGNGSAQLA